MKKVVRGGKRKIYKEVLKEDEYCHPRVIRMFKKENILIIYEGSLRFSYDIDRVTLLQMREHKRQGVQ